MAQRILELTREPPAPDAGYPAALSGG